VVTTNASGIAVSPYFTANATKGTYTIKARVGFTASADFTETNK